MRHSRGKRNANSINANARTERTKSRRNAFNILPSLNQGAQYRKTCTRLRRGRGLVRYRADLMFTRHYHAGVPRLCSPYSGEPPERPPSTPRFLDTDATSQNDAAQHCEDKRKDFNASSTSIKGAHVKRLRKHPDKSLERTAVPTDFEPDVIDETDDGGCTIIVPARPPQETAKTDPPTKTKR